MVPNAEIRLQLPTDLVENIQPILEKNGITAILQSDSGGLKASGMEVFNIVVGAINLVSFGLQIWQMLRESRKKKEYAQIARLEVTVKVDASLYIEIDPQIAEPLIKARLERLQMALENPESAS